MTRAGLASVIDASLPRLLNTRVPQLSACALLASVYSWLRPPQLTGGVFLSFYLRFNTGQKVVRVVRSGSAVCVCVLVHNDNFPTK